MVNFSYLNAAPLSLSATRAKGGESLSKVYSSRHTSNFFEFLEIIAPMLMKSLALPLLTFESAMYCHFSPTVLSISASNLAPHILDTSSRVISQNKLRSRKILSADQTQVAVLEDEEKKSWEECEQALSALDFTLEEAGTMLRKAFGWKHSPYWGEDRKKEVPKNESVRGVLDFLRSLGLSDDDLHKLLKKFPEVLGCDFDKEVKANVVTLERQWGVKGKQLRNLLLRNPKVLGYNVDCKGDCMAQCTRCWVRF